VSSTGYRSVFPSEKLMYEIDEVVIEKCRETAEYLHENRLKEIAKEASKRKRRVKAK
jgi:hypothetical protein